jgi:glucose/arabinose dehydrogenase
VARGRLEGMTLTDVAVIFEALPQTTRGYHFGSRLAFGPGNILYVTAGERNERARAQRLDDLGGKVVRLNDDGSVPADNPFLGQAGARPEIFTYGHRNPQGLLVHPATGEIWEIEHGPRGGDEINLLTAGANYGWPIVTKGREYSGLPIGDGKSRPEMVDPARFWVPSISPSGIAFYAGDAFPGWRGCLFIGALSGEMLVRLEMNGLEIAGEERLLEGKVGRIRDVSEGPDGRLYLLIDDDDGALLRLDPA